MAAIIALAALRARALTRGGSLAAFIVGTITFASGGLAYAAILLAFFVTSVALGRVGKARKGRLTDVGKLGARDAAQVLANGGVATLCALPLALVSVSGPWFAAIVAAFAGAYAAATADTWGTEIGTLVRAAPRSIVTWRPIAAGLSGGVTAAGTLAEVAGAACIGIVASASLRLLPGVTELREAFPLAGALAVTLGGITGALVDSLLGGTLQELRRCPVCERACEIDPHTCGSPTSIVRGLPGVSNDLVNGAATLTGALVAGALAVLWYARA